MLISCARSRSHVAVPIFKLVGFIHSLMPRFLIHSNIAVMIFRLSIGSHIPIHKKNRQSKYGLTFELGNCHEEQVAN
jgi:hypothetical protein